MTAQPRHDASQLRALPPAAGPCQALPANPDAEEAVLGSILLNRDAIAAIADSLSPEMFYNESYRMVYAAMLDLYHRRTPPDVRTTFEELRRRGQLEQLGSMPFLVQLSASVPTSYHIQYYAQIVRATALRRQLLDASMQIARLAVDETDELAATFDAAEAALFAVSERQTTQDFVMLGQVVEDYHTRLNERQDRHSEVVGLSTGLHDLDDLTAGLQRSDLLILAARPSVGKTSLALTIANTIASAGADRVVGIFSLEMSREQLLLRLLAMRTGFDVHRLRTGMLRDTELQQLLTAMDELAALPIAIDDTAAQSLMAVRSKARRLQAQRGLDLVIVDYLQLMTSGGQPEHRVQEVSAISRGLKALARELNVPVIALSQLTRAVEGRMNHVPLLSDLRESGALEQDADVVLFIHREELYDKETDKKGIAELHIAKHRNGPVGVVPVRFEPQTTRFLNLSYRTLEA